MAGLGQLGHSGQAKIFIVSVTKHVICMLENASLSIQQSRDGVDPIHPKVLLNH